MKRAFTLIELLVVTAITAIFLIFLLYQVTQARYKAIDQRNREALALAQSYEESFFSQNNAYQGLAAALADQQFTSVFTKVGLQFGDGGSGGTYPNVGFRSNGRQIVFWVESKAEPKVGGYSKYLCADSAGVSTSTIYRPACAGYSYCPPGTLPSGSYWCY
ncbi:MAG: type II secretion system protein, partial [bacterium]